MPYAYLTVVISEEPLSLSGDTPALYFKTPSGELVVSPLIEMKTPNHETIFFRVAGILKDLVKSSKAG